MSELRWILIGFGIVLLAGIYLWGRRGGAAVAEDVALRSRPEPAMQPHGFTEVRREPAYQREDIPDYEEPSYEENERARGSGRRSKAAGRGLRRHGGSPGASVEARVWKLAFLAASRRDR